MLRTSVVMLCSVSSICLMLRQMQPNAKCRVQCWAAGAWGGGGWSRADLREKCSTDWTEGD